MSADDPHRFSNRLDAATAQRLIDRLESRARDAVFNRLLEQYLTEMRLPENARVLEVGCGTGATSRAVARRAGFSGTVTGVDQSPAFIGAARRFAKDEGLEQSIEFHVGDAHDLDFEPGSFDVVIAHTLISHVTDPASVLRELARVTRKDGTVAIFDGDYASLTYSYPDHEFGRRMDQALVSVTFNNPLIMRDLVRLLPEAGLGLEKALANVVSEIGKGSYFKSFAETYVPLVVGSGLVEEDQVRTWQSAQNEAMQAGTFFAACNYYTFIARRR
jgi:ubiquinone/menaquinone biosynthesis C-methylase UbiE